MLLAILTLSGCRDRGLRLVPVTGSITLDGKPLAEAGVLFRPCGELPPASGCTNSQGRFRLETLNRPGAVLGEYSVSIVKQEATGQNALGVAGMGAGDVRNIVPVKYNKPDTSGLHVTVTAQTHDFTFDLSSLEQP